MPNTSKDDLLIAKYTLVAIALHVFEAALPSLIPGLKPGLANVVTLIVFVRHGWRWAAWVCLLRVLGSSLFLGSFLTPGFLLSLSGALASVVVLKANSWLPGKGLSIVGLSILSAIMHIAAQVVVAYAVIIQHAAIFHLVPIFLIGATLLGTITGFIAYYALASMESSAESSGDTAA